MISIRAMRPSPSTAALVRLAAFLVAAASAIVIPVQFYAAATGHAGVHAAFAIAAVALALTLATTMAARSLDPLRR